MSFKRHHIILPVFFIFFIFVLSSLPVSTILARIYNMTFFQYLKCEIKQYSPVSVRTLRSIVQNGLHIPIFAILTFLWLQFFRIKGVPGKKKFLYTFLIVLLISHLDEFYQYWLPERDASVLDLVLDMLGFFLGLIIFNRISATPANFKEQN